MPNNNHHARTINTNYRLLLPTHVPVNTNRTNSALQPNRTNTLLRAPTNNPSPCPISNDLHKTRVSHQSVRNLKKNQVLTLKIDTLTHREVQKTC
ncbi:hypothetical protein NXF25_016654 [Crotalus adamanteus]|uniref:Uncharacterized protein n=1 Tax=Crotalus adamanteus TaxID=8729 RepID=A0AAW1AUH4_CROAD